ncbi:MAG: VOC family protein [Pikeienuella sp.]
MTPTFALDHLVIAAPTLARGVDHVRDRLGVTVPEGGRHPLMGTHNRLMRLGGDEFLEIIAVDPDAPPPARPRWYALDRHEDRAPFLTTWVARVGDLDAALKLSPPGMGAPIRVSRGDLIWRIAAPEDGSMPFGGAFPTLLEWPDDQRPGAAMPDRGCALRKLTIEHPEADAIRARLKGFLRDERIVFRAGERVTLSAEIDTPAGPRVLA